MARREGDRPLLDLCRYHPCEPRERERVLTRLVKEHRLQRDPCVAVLEPGAFSLLPVDPPQVPDDELRAAVTWRLRDMLDFPVDEAVIDLFDVPGEAERGRPGVLYAVAAPIATVQERVDVLRAAGFELSAIDIPELCQRNIAGLLAEDARGAALVTLSQHGGLITLSREGVLYLSRTLELGISQLAADGTHGLALDPQPALDTIVLEVQRSLDYYESHFREAPIGHVFLAPTQREVPGVVDSLAANLAARVEAFELASVLELGDDWDRQTQAASLLAVGAALRSPATGKGRS